MTAPRCDNDAHHDDITAGDEFPLATVRMSWPDGRFIEAYACDHCALHSVQVYVLDDFDDGARHAVLIEPLPVNPSATEATP